MALTDSNKLRSSNDKKFKGHTEDKTIKVAIKPGDPIDLFKQFKKDWWKRMGGKNK